METKPITIVALIVLAAVVYAGAHSVGTVPALGGLLDPVHGAWRGARNVNLPRNVTVKLPLLRDSVQVRYDIRGVPHIFAATEEDAYRALGYVVARDRLFQMDLQAHAGSGRLTEMVGDRALAMDEETRTRGIPRAVERKFAALDTDSPSRKMIDAYAAGVNAYIDRLSPEDYPIEYKLLDVRPEHWRAINSIYLLATMGQTLAGADPERTFARVAAVVGREAAMALFPLHTPIEEPIQPEPRWKGPRMAFAPIPPPGLPDKRAAGLVAMYDAFDGPQADAAHQSGFASNNWAVAPSRTRDGYALLAGDPHLDLSLPSIWYEVQMTVPGKLDVYGVTIPGAPGIIIGFNRNIAWTFTNTGADVTDFYRETVDDSLDPTQYMLDGAWRPLVPRVETYLAPDGGTLYVDTVLFTHRGPITKTHGQWVSMRWTVLEPSEEIRAFYDAAHARTAAEFQAAMAHSFFVPAQNMLVADRQGTIAIRSTGHFPLRPDNGSGLVVRDGSTTASDWIGYWPVYMYPQSFNPRQGYLASANQEPEVPASEFAYLGTDAEFYPWRALRINELLRADSSVTPDQMRRWQTDPGSARADLFVPYFLAAARTATAAGLATTDLATAAELLGEWDRRYTRDNERAVLFEAAMRELADRTWDELAPDGEHRVATPSDAVLAELLSQPKNEWWDDLRTDATIEDRDNILAVSLLTAYRDVVMQYGVPAGGGWRWSEIRHVNIYHLLRIPAFSALDIPVQGGPGTLNPSSGNGIHGPSWRMVVQLGPEIRAWGTLPGGESGDPNSARYTNHLQSWTEGRLDPLIFPHSAADLRGGATTAVLTLLPQRR
jgi:penicillin amidase